MCRDDQGGREMLGGNGNGEVGNGEGGEGSDGVSYEDVPVDVAGLRHGVETIAASNFGAGQDPSHTCAVTVAGAVKCWGSGDSGAAGQRNGRGLSPSD